MITVLSGDATAPTCDGSKIIAHVCNDVGAWGKGFVLAVSNRWLGPEQVYRAAKDWTLGTVQFIQVTPDTQVANMIAQRGIRGKKPLVRYWAVEQCLTRVAGRARELSASVHMPRIGCGLGGGQWRQIEPLIIKQLWDIPVYVYDWEK